MGGTSVFSADILIKKIHCESIAMGTMGLSEGLKIVRATYVHTLLLKKNFELTVPSIKLQTNESKNGMER